MKRLTLNFQYDGIDRAFAKTPDDLDFLQEVANKLGIDLITLFKALTNGIWYKEKNNIKYLDPDSLKVVIYKDGFTILELYFDDLDCVMDTTGRKWGSSQYKKDWALTKEELENVQ